MAAVHKSKGSAPLPAKLAGLLREAKWLALVGAAGYLLLILVTHHATDPGWSRSATAAGVQNAGGRGGAPLSGLPLSHVGLGGLLGWLRVAEVTGLLLEAAYAFARGAWERRRDEKIGEQAREVRETVVQAERKREEDHPPLVIAPPPPEIKRSERAKKEIQAEKQARLFEHLPDTPLPPLNLLDDADKQAETVGAETLEFTSRLIEKK